MRAAFVTNLVEVRSSGISSVVDNKSILELPLQGRQVTDLIVLAGAAVQTGLTERGLPGGVSARSRSAGQQRAHRSCSTSRRN